MSNPAKSATKAVYLVKSEDPTSKKGVVYYRSQDLTVGTSVVSIRGSLIDEKFINDVLTNPLEEIGEEVNMELPLNRIISIQNATYTGTKTAKRKAVLRAENGQIL